MRLLGSSPCVQGEVGRGCFKCNAYGLMGLESKAPLPNPPLHAGEGAASHQRRQSFPSPSGRIGTVSSVSTVVRTGPGAGL